MNAEQLIARTIKKLARPAHDVPTIANMFADAMTGTNANFDRAKFLKACGV